MIIELKKLRPVAIPLSWETTFRVLVACPFALFISGCTSAPQKHAGSCDYEKLFENAINQSGYSFSSKNKDQLKVIFDLFFHEIEKNKCKKSSSFNYWDDHGLTFWQKYNGLRIGYLLRLKLLSNNDICLSGFRLTKRTAASYQVYCQYKGWTWYKKE
ncbi:hypothetical protein ACQU0X_23275 [Pseudovibrio ascidiaceicola]|uniref:hypothetical protein n=1 Tax=Pseudovibrio ascidiaceicola TaxID=285279 RepID=UPI003D35AF83